MPTLTPLNIATIILDVSAVMLVMGILLQTRFMRRSGRESDQLFTSMLETTVVMALSDMAGYITENRPGAIWVNIQIISMTIFYLAFTILAMLWADYCSLRFKDGERIKRIGLQPAYIPGVLVIGVVFLNQFTELIFSVDEKGGYHREILFIPMYLVLIIYLVAGFIAIGRYRTADKKMPVPLWLYVLPILVSAVVTFGVGEVSMAALGTAITIAFTHLGSMNEVAEMSFKESVQ